MSVHRRLFLQLVSCVISAGAASRLAAQPVFSLDFHGPTMGVPDSFFAVPISEGDLLVAFPAGFPLPGPLPPPGIVVFGGFPSPGPNMALPMYGAPPFPAPGVASLVEVDALSFGTDLLLRPLAPFMGVWTFSVNEFATSYPPGPLFPPNLLTQGAAGALQASADVFSTFPPGAFPPGPIGPGVVPPPRNADLVDGDGLPAPPGPHPALGAVVGLGLLEPNPPTVPPFSLPDPGDNLDALDIDTGGLPGAIPFPIYISLDAAYFDAVEGPPPPGFGPVNSGSAVANGGFAGADILMVPAPGIAPIVYAPAGALGLNLFGFDTDDLDALVISENGIPGYQPAAFLYAWGPGAGDQVLFSVRAGSAVIGAADSIFGIPIMPGDILVPPMGGAVFPGIFIAAENLGLATARAPLFMVPDELDALDVSPDCNGNGVPDRLDVLPPPWPGLADCNGNLVPDICETMVCGDGACCPPENSCNCALDCGPPPLNEIIFFNCTDGLDNDCDGRIDCMDIDCAGDPACCGDGICLPGEACSCPADCGPPAAAEVPGLTCADGLDNDCDGAKDCSDLDCAMDLACSCGDGICNPWETPCTCPPDCGGPMPEVAGANCADGIDNDCDGATDCADPGCAADPICACPDGACGPGENPCTCPADCGAPAPEMAGFNCADGIDNDCDGATDCADAGCAADPACACPNGTCGPGENPCTCPADCGLPAIEMAGANCADGIDNDCDGATDCADAGCAADPACVCPNGNCGPGENPCTCPADCGLPAIEMAGANCADGIDNDCDGATDCADAGCAADPACACPNGTCGPGENPCTCPADCGLPAIEMAGVNCTDAIDNDCDGMPDCVDPGCLTDLACSCGNGICDPWENPCNCVPDCGPPPAEVPGPLCSDGIDNDCDTRIDCTDPDCAMDLSCSCPNGACEAWENSCNCAADCGAPVAETAGTNCADGVDNDCDGLKDCADPGCIGDPTCGCVTDVDCDDANGCTCDDCNAGTCTFTGTIFGDPTCDGFSELADILCLLAGYAVFSDCPNADIYPCTGDLLIELGDVLWMLDAYSGIDHCMCP